MTEIKHKPYVEVAVALPVFNTYTYKIPDSLISFCKPGKRLLVPFRNRRVTGYVVDLHEKTSINELRYIFDVLDEDPLFPCSMIPFYKWIANYYFYPIGMVIKGALPDSFSVYEISILSITDKGLNAVSNELLNPLQKNVLIKLKKGQANLRSLRKEFDDNLPYSCIKNMEKKEWIQIKKTLKNSSKPKTEIFIKFITAPQPDEKLSAAKKKILEILSKQKILPQKALNEIVSSPKTHVNYLEKKGFVSTYTKQVLRDPFDEAIIEGPAPPELTEEQKNVLSQVVDSLGQDFKSYLLFGVTGSGKTEVYLHACDAAMKLGYTAIVLVPEIALISQLGRLFRMRFRDKVAILHSGLSKGERYDQWMRIIRGEASIVIGARSAVFAPLVNTGLIIVDEEHDPSYKQGNNLRYNGRDIAILRAKLENCPVLLGSATPSVQSYFNSLQNKFTKINITKRVENRKLPEIQIVDLKNYKGVRGIRKFITPPLEKAISETVMNGKQALIFLNRRGFSTLPVCASCGLPMKCKNCDITMTYHKKINAYKCHYCGYNKSFTSNCTCGSEEFIHLGLGTEKLEEAMKSIFPYARIARMDQDTTRKKGANIKILKDVRDNMTDILLGTQMIAKGHDFPNITLVGVICADLTLSFPDFRSSELTFQLLSQVSGRAGRGDSPGNVIMQTYNPDHFIITTAKEQDYEKFYSKEIQYRQMLKYPPYSRLVQILISGRDENKTKEQSIKIGEYCRHLHNLRKAFQTSIQILGPVKAPVAMLKNQYRWQLLLKGFNVQVLHLYIESIFFNEDSPVNKTRVNIIVDVDPMDMM